MKENGCFYYYLYIKDIYREKDQKHGFGTLTFPNGTVF